MIWSDVALLTRRRARGRYDPNELLAERMSVPQSRWVYFHPCQFLYGIIEEVQKYPAPDTDSKAEEQLPQVTLLLSE